MTADFFPDSATSRKNSRSGSHDDKEIDFEGTELQSIMDADTPEPNNPSETDNIEESEADDDDTCHNNWRRRKETLTT